MAGVGRICDQTGEEAGAKEHLETNRLYANHIHVLRKQSSWAFWSCLYRQRVGEDESVAIAGQLRTKLEIADDWEMAKCSYHASALL